MLQTDASMDCVGFDTTFAYPQKKNKKPKLISSGK